MTRVSAAALALAATVTASACAGVTGGSNDGRLSVVAALYPLSFVVERVGGGRVQVTDLTPVGAEPHDLELSPTQVATLNDADLVVYLGSGFQPAVEDAVESLDGARKLDALSRLPVIETDGRADPHVWLSPPLLAEMADSVAGRLGDIDPKEASAYRRRAKRLRTGLARLDSGFKEALTSCERRDIVVSHEAFGYLAQRYDLHQIGIAGIDPESEPLPARLGEVERLVDERGITTVFYERLGSPAVAQTIARATDTETAPLDPIESPPAHGDFFTAMRSNLMELTDALDC